MRNFRRSCFKKKKLAGTSKKLNSIFSRTSIDSSEWMKRKLQRMSNSNKVMWMLNNEEQQIIWPSRFPGIVGNAGNHGNNGKFHKSDQTINET